MTAQGPAAGQTHAPSVDTTDVLGRRIGAYVIDSILLGIVFVILGLATGGGSSSDNGASIKLGGGATLLFVVISFAYFIVCEGMTGQTLGKRLLGIRVVNQDGSRVSFGASFIRNILRIVDALPVLYIVGLITVLATGERRQRVGDLAARTRVVRA